LPTAALVRERAEVNVARPGNHPYPSRIDEFRASTVRHASDGADQAVVEKKRLNTNAICNHLGEDIEVGRRDMEREIGMGRRAAAVVQAAKRGGSEVRPNGRRIARVEC
jgi:hypothetical protein